MGGSFHLFQRLVLGKWGERSAADAAGVESTNHLMRRFCTGWNGEPKVVYICWDALDRKTRGKPPLDRRGMAPSVLSESRLGNPSAAPDAPS